MASSGCITDFTVPQLQELIASLSESKYRANQLQRWLYHRLALSFDEMTDLPRILCQRLANEVRLHSLEPVDEIIAPDGTVKILFNLADDKSVEATLMSYPDATGKGRHTVCLSTQVGCPVGCPFCATGQQGYERNLSPGEIIDQVLYFARRLKDRSGKASFGSGPQAAITNLVFMGMGEPLANYDALLQAIEMLNSPDGFGLGARNMVVSTAGMVPQIKRLSREKLQVGLAISLHAADNALRNTLVPLNRRYPLERLIPACREYFEQTGRRPTFEYALFEGINDSADHACSLARLLNGLNCHVNLIPANKTSSKQFRPPKRSAVIAFENELRRQHINCTLREKKGIDINAGCGQLRSRFVAKQADSHLN